MNYLGKFVTGFKYFYDEINQSNLTGAIDVVVVKDEQIIDGQKVVIYKSSPFHVKFGKYDILQPKERRVDITINGKLVDVKMKLGGAGEVYFPRPNEVCDCKTCLHQANLAMNKLKTTNNLITTPPITNITQDDSISHMDMSFNALSDSELYDFVSDRKKRSMSECEIKDISARPLKRVTKWKWGELPQTVKNSRNIATTKSPNQTQMIDVIEDEDSASFTSDTEIAIISDRMTSLLSIENSPNNSPIRSRPRNSSMLSVSNTTESKRKVGKFTDSFECRISLCGGLNNSVIKPTKFEELLLTFETLAAQPTILYDKDAVVEINGKYYDWMVAAPIIVSSCIFNKTFPKESIKDLKSQYKKKKQMKSWFAWRNATTEGNEKVTSDEDNDHKSLRSENVVEPEKPPANQNKCKRRVLKLESDNIAMLGLHDGANEISFTVTSKFQGTVTINSRIFLWDKLDKIVISDIDGTITKSDVLGHVMYFVGKEWVHQGVTKVLNQIRSNGYRIVYLSSRTIGIANITRNFIQTVNTDELHLPEGPILLSPSSLFQSIHAEIIENKPEIFKIGCLTDISSLFPQSIHPFYSGFGNRMNDALAYKTMGINDSHIFIINKKGQIKNEHSQYQSITFDSLSTYVNHIFPKVTDEQSATQLDQTPELHNYSDLIFWKSQYIPKEDTPSNNNTATTSTANTSLNTSLPTNPNGDGSPS